MNSLSLRVRACHVIIYGDHHWCQCLFTGACSYKNPCVRLSLRALQLHVSPEGAVSTVKRMDLGETWRQPTDNFTAHPKLDAKT
eukprot:scaffold34544_cov19-Tisochrysis_lutea.AAC.1